MKTILVTLFLFATLRVVDGQELNFDAPSDSRKKEMYVQMGNGDLSVLASAAENREAGVLWFYVQAISSDPRFVSENDTRIRERSKALLSKLPGHTQVMIDRIEKSHQETKDIKLSLDGNHIAGTEKPANTEEELRVIEDLQHRARITAEPVFTALKQLGSTECVQTLMTYIDDERRIGMSTGGTRPGYRPASANSWMAIQMLAGILGQENPAMQEFTHHGWSYDIPAMRQRFKDWWLSDASKKWRTPIVKTSRSHLLPGTTKAPPTEPSPVSAVISPGRQALWQILVILCFATLAAVLGFAKLRRGN